AVAQNRAGRTLSLLEPTHLTPPPTARGHYPKVIHEDETPPGLRCAPDVSTNRGGDAETRRRFALESGRTGLQVAPPGQGRTPLENRPDLRRIKGQVTGPPAASRPRPRQSRPGHRFESAILGSLPQTRPTPPPAALRRLDVS